MAVLVLALAACGGSGSGDPGTTAAGGPGTSSTDAGTTTTGGTTTAEGGSSAESWIEIDSVRRTATTVCDSNSERVSVGELDPRFVVNANLYDDGDLRVSVDAGDLQGVARSEDGYKWANQGGVPNAGLDLTIDSSGIRGGPITLTSEDGTTVVANFDLRYSRPTCWREGDEWANLSGSTPSGEVYARFDAGGDIVEFDESQIVECSFDSRITDTGMITMASARNVTPAFYLRVGFSLSPGNHFYVDTDQGSFGAGPDSRGDVLTIQGEGRKVQGTATMRTDSGDLPISFEASCG